MIGGLDGGNTYVTSLLLLGDLIDLLLCGRNIFCRRLSRSNVGHD
jgi:hypothetical protein